ncbi:MAG: Zn-ribbon domain-containing OB-fold protein [Candidatus Bathyarchaeota archaeon]|uniref:Zn-ribbon domain-containing OB-fold protein n=1 Tax=Candidatus Bathycorpusculum sp. TaxID=2994959 RepID=UPI0028193065|nr:Zn-ribbon domain-containing OB-fold protein [Candidatus Termiticorpusculum sp.]MCL2256840.1 Zn-ribbon domain-containing OB-fold protein [Candidatus Termiticorpusculum sp.]MCL2293033.1 Zn-ribbon domain-containing OB-fold protein [Candidatus Termiticorpusculum sp.]
MSTQEQFFCIEQFYKSITQGKLLAGKCLKCGKIHLPPRPLCDNCYSNQFEWTPIPNKGVLLTYTVIHIAPTQFQNLTPYIIGIIELENGLKIPGTIQGVAQEQLKIGMILQVDFNTCNTATQQQQLPLQPQTWPQWPKYCLKP